jgi:hypothetical protein
MLRRDLMKLPALAAIPAAPARRTGLCVNEDNSHWFFTRAGEPVTKESVASFVDQYQGISELMLCPNSQRINVESKVFDPVWKGYDPNGPDDQPLFRSTPPASRKIPRDWVHRAWALNQAGLDPYKIWIERARQLQVSPWISMRMNDLHEVQDPDRYLHGSFWRAHPEYRRMGWRTTDWRDSAFDYSHPEVREYHFKLVEEYCERYDFDGLELDWMRFGFHFRPGHELEGGELLTGFMRRTRRLLDQWQRKRGHAIQLGARVPSRPQTAIQMGMDGARWAREGLIQMLVVTPFWASIETDIPIELWRRLAGDKVTLAAGLEVLLRPYHAYRPLQYNSREAVRGAAAAMLAKGADRVYLFNYMDRAPEVMSQADYVGMMKECGSLERLAGQKRRFIVSYADTWAPGEAEGAQLPKTLAAGEWAAFRLPIGPKMKPAQLRMELDGCELDEVRLNGEPCRPTGHLEGVKPGPPRGLETWEAPGEPAGVCVIHVRAKQPGRIHWVELSA